MTSPTRPRRPPGYARSRATNRPTLLAGVDGRSAWARRFRDLLAQQLADLGGIDRATTAEASIARRAAALTVELERLETVFARDGEASAEMLDLYGRTAGNLRRLLESIGLQRRSKDITPALSDYIEGRAE